MKNVIKYLPVLLLLGACGKNVTPSNPSSSPGTEVQKVATVPQSPVEIKRISRSFQFRAVSDEKEKCSKLAFWNDLNLDGQYDPEVDRDRVEHRFCGDKNSPQSASVKTGTIGLTAEKGTQLGYLLSKTDVKVCEYGGFKLELWIDNNKDGVFQKETDSAVVEFTTCNGKDGSSPFTTSERVTQHPACPAAATVIKTFLDLNRNQKYDPGIDSNYQEQPVCDGKDGSSTAFKLEDVEKEPSCGTKAVRLTSWTDVNGNGTYEEGVDTQLHSKVICHGKDFKSDFIGTFTKEGHALSLDLNRYAWHEWRTARAPSAIYGEFLHFETTASKLMTFQPEYFECRGDGKGVEAIARADFFKMVEAAAQQKSAPLTTKKGELEKVLAQAESDKAASESHLKAAMLQLESVKAAIAKLSEKIQRQEGQLTGLNDSLAEKEAALAELNQLLNKKMEELKKATLTESTWLASVSGLTAKVNALASDLSRVEAELKRETEELAKWQAMVAQRTKNISDSDADIKALTAKVEAIKKESGWDWFGGRKRRLEKAKEALTLALGKRNNYVVELTAFKASELKSIAKVAEVESQRNQVSQILAQEGQLLSNAKANAQAATMAKQALVTVVNGLTTQQATAGEFISGLKATIQTVSQSLAANRTELKNAEQLQAGTEAKIANLGQKLTQLVALISQSRAELSQIAITLERLSKAATVATARQVYFYHFDELGALELKPTEGNQKSLLLGKAEKPQIPDTDLLCSTYVDELTQ